MASCQTSQWVSTAPYVKLTVTEQTGSSVAKSILNWTLQYVASSAANTSVAKSYKVIIGGVERKSGTYSIDGKTGTHTIATGSVEYNRVAGTPSVTFEISFGFNLTWSGVYKGTLTANGGIRLTSLPSYGIKYNANGGSGAPSTQTKWYGTALTLSSTKPTRTGYSFQGWATSSGGSVAYASGANYTANSAVTLYAVWKPRTFVVTYNANGGVGAPGDQTKTYNMDLTLSSTKPTKTNHNFLGWGTSSSATTISYKSGDVYKNNSSIHLYAIWELAYQPPRMSNTMLHRCMSDGTYTDEGKCVRISFNWECDVTISKIVVNYKISSDENWISTTFANLSGTSGTFSTILGSGSTIFDPERTYLFDIIIEDASDISHNIITLNGAIFDIDIIAGGGGVSIGKPAEIKGLFDVGYKTRFFGGIEHMVLEPETDLDDILTPNTYIGANISNNNYSNCPLTSGTFTLIVEGAGEEGQVKQILTRCSKTEPERYIRTYYHRAWGEWMPDAYDTIYVKETGTDLNDYLYSGVYYFSSSYTPTNIPSGTNGWLTVMRADSGAIKQLWHRYGNTILNDHNTYVRTRGSSSWGPWRRYSVEPEVLYNGNSAGTITLSLAAGNFEYLEIFYTDNNGKTGGYSKVYSPGNKTVSLSITESGDNGNTYIRRTNYTFSNLTMTPDLTTAGYIRVNGSSAWSNSIGTNYIKIVRILGHRA